MFQPLHPNISNISTGARLRFEQFKKKVFIRVKLLLKISYFQSSISQALNVRIILSENNISSDRLEKKRKKKTAETSNRNYTLLMSSDRTNY